MWILASGVLCMVNGQWFWLLNQTWGFALRGTRYALDHSVFWKGQSLPRNAYHQILPGLLFSAQPPLIKVHPAYSAQRIGQHIQKVGVSKWNEILVNFIADAVKRRRSNAEQDEAPGIGFYSQGLKSPEK